eukprot:Gb_11894 [translate_table: standard]
MIGVLLNHQFPCRKGVKGAQPGPVLTWMQRVKISVGAAKGLEYLHEKAQPPIIHRDIKSSNVLLFDDCTAKIADFDLSNQAPDMAARLHSTRVLGTFGYHAPDLMNHLLLGVQNGYHSATQGGHLLFAVTLMSQPSKGDVFSVNRKAVYKVMPCCFRLYSDCCDSLLVSPSGCMYAGLVIQGLSNVYWLIGSHARLQGIPAYTRCQGMEKYVTCLSFMFHAQEVPPEKKERSRTYLILVWRESRQKSPAAQ